MVFQPEKSRKVAASVVYFFYLNCPLFTSLPSRMGLIIIMPGFENVLKKKLMLISLN